MEHYVSGTFAGNARHLVCNRRKALCEDDYGPSVRTAMSTVITADCKVPTGRFEKRSISHAKIPENYTAHEPRANCSHYVTHVRKTRHGQKTTSPARFCLRAAEAERVYSVCASAIYFFLSFLISSFDPSPGLQIYIGTLYYR